MNRNIFNFDLNGKNVLGFDTGLDPQAFAQAKLARLITSQGDIVFPGGRAEAWRQEGVSEQGSMIIWGPAFPGESLAEITGDPSRKDEALEALCRWIKARLVLREKSVPEREAPFPGPEGALVVTGKSREEGSPFPEGTVFFPPSRLLKRTFEAAGTALDAERWVHPDLKGNEEISFSAGVMLYRIFCGVLPFSKNDEDELRQDIREAVFVPAELAAPGIDPELAAVINRAMSRKNTDGKGPPRPPPEAIAGFLGPDAPKKAALWVRPLKEDEREKIRRSHDRYIKKRGRSVKTRRFVIRNTTIIAGSVIAVIALAFFIRGIIQRNADLPTTKGMSPARVAEAYYGAYGTLDHIMMDACVTGSAGKSDIEMIINLFVTTRVRQAYETGSVFMSAREWIDAGSPATDKTVFGITGLSIKELSENNGTAEIEAAYILWMPGAYFADSSAPVNGTAPPPEALLPGGIQVTDRVSLALRKDLWHITAIDRAEKVLPR